MNEYSSYEIQLDNSSDSESNIAHKIDIYLDIDKVWVYILHLIIIYINGIIDMYIIYDNQNMQLS